MATVPGIDVSRWNDEINWTDVSSSGQRYAFIKATESFIYKDARFGENWSGAKAAGLLRGAYHFFRCNADPKKQADYFIAQVKPQKNNDDLPPILDLETNDGVTKEQIARAAKTWLDCVETAFGKKPIIYSSQYFLQDYLSLPGGGPPEWVKDYQLWLAQYPAQYAEGLIPTLPRGWSNWTFWQYSDKGHIDGIKSAVSLNKFNGTIADLYKLANAKDKEPRIHKIAEGDTFDTIANKYGVSVSELASANPQLIKAGNMLNLPTAAAPFRKNKSSTPSGSAPEARRYKIQRGDTLTLIAVQYGTTVAAIASTNKIKNINNPIKVGRVLVIP